MYLQNIKERSQRETAHKIHLQNLGGEEIDSLDDGKINSLEDLKRKAKELFVKEVISGIDDQSNHKKKLEEFVSPIHALHHSIVILDVEEEIWVILGAMSEHISTEKALRNIGNQVSE